MKAPLSVRLRRGQGPIFGPLKSLLQKAMRAEFPVPAAILGPVHAGYQAHRQLRAHLSRAFFFQPLFRSRADSVGEDFYLYGGFPVIEGNLRIAVGDGCKISAQTTLAAGHVNAAPELVLGDHTNIGPGVVISVGKKVTLGSNVRIGSGVFICDNPGHPLDAKKRRTSAVDPVQIKPVRIDDDVWVGTSAIVLPGVHIGARSIIGAGSVVTRDVPPDCVAAGNPARITRRMNPQLKKTEAEDAA
jgi:acetyltransferase-like isoleucine patch superfamily enzyme